MSRYALVGVALMMVAGTGRAFVKPLQPFLERHCYECHDDGLSEADLDLTGLSTNLDSEAALAKWIRVYDRVRLGEMPPEKKTPPATSEKAAFAKLLAPALTAAHARHKGTVLRRLNRREYENTLNDLFGTEVALAAELPEDGRAHEFDVVGEALGMSMTHLERYVAGANKVLDAAIVRRIEAPKPAVKTASYATGRDKKFIGKNWFLAPDGAVVFFRRWGYPSGMLREANFETRGHYKVRVTGYAYQADKPITFSLGATSFARGSEKPIFGYFAMQPGEPQTVEVEVFVDARYMIAIEPVGLEDPQNKLRNTPLETYEGPGLAISAVEIEGPLLAEWPRRGHHLVFDGVERREIMPGNPKQREKSWYKPRFEVVTTDPEADAARSLQRVATAAFRRPVTTADVAPYLALFRDEAAAGADFETALRTAIAAVLTSPKFLYLVEPAGRLDDYALATRLSYFLARTTPDEPLLKAAAAGRLTGDKGELRRQTERLLADPRFDRFVEDFTDAWLNLREIEFTAPDKVLFPEFDRYLQDAMMRETRDYFRALVAENLPVRHLVKSDFTIANERLAEHYGLPGVAGPAYRKVSLPADSVRGGFLAHASIHKVSANGNNTSPVVRGTWVLERILGQPSPPPPPGIPGVEPDVRGATTLREILAKHRDQPSCNSCHQHIDPPGFALEAFNPIGGYRDYFRSLGEGEKIPPEDVGGRRVRYRKGPAVDASSELPGGQQFADFASYRDHLATDQRTLAHTLAGKLLTFSTGRELGFSDRPELARIADEAAKDEYRIRDLIHAVVASKIFQNK